MRDSGQSGGHVGYERCIQIPMEIYGPGYEYESFRDTKGAYELRGYAEVEFHGGFYGLAGNIEIFRGRWGERMLKYSGVFFLFLRGGHVRIRRRNVITWD